MHTNELNPGGAEHPPGGLLFGGHSRGPRALSIKKPHPPLNAVDKGKIVRGKRRNFVPEFCLEDSLSISAKICIVLSHGPLCGCERSGATREASAVNLAGLVRSVMQMETRGQVPAKTSGL